MKKRLLVVVDMQNDFVTGSLGSDRAQTIVPNVRAKIEAYKKNGDIIIFTRDTHQADYLQTAEGRALPVEHCIEGAAGWQIVDELRLAVPDCMIVDKPNFGWYGWRDTLADFANEISAIELVGLCTDICVVSNALILKAAYPDMPVAVDATCCAGVTSESHDAALLTMKMCQIDVSIPFSRF